MDAADVKERVRLDLQPVTTQRTDIEKTLIEPFRETFECLDTEDRILWVVGKKDGFFITLDEENDEYGLAFRNIVSSFVYLGDNGSLGKAYTALVTRNQDDTGEGKKTSEVDRKSKADRFGAKGKKRN